MEALFEVEKDGRGRETPSPIFIVSGGTGASGEQLVRTALAQFEAFDRPLVIVPHVNSEKGVDVAVQQALASGGIIIYTLVHPGLRRALTRQAREQKVVAIDLMGRVLSQLTRILGRKPIGRPGVYRQLRKDYFNRIEAIEFAVEHDDGRKLHELQHAQIVLIGVSRLGKTPLSIYLSMLGWKVANIPIVPEVQPPDELSEIRPERGVGLTIDPNQLLVYRRPRTRRLGMDNTTSYVDPVSLREEVAVVRRLCQRYDFPVVNVTNKPIEESAHEIIALVTRRTGDDT